MKFVLLPVFCFIDMSLHLLITAVRKLYAPVACISIYISPLSFIFIIKSKVKKKI